MKKYFVVLICVTLISSLYISCNKDPGSGGTSFIRGKVWVKQYDKTFSTLTYSYGGYNQTVYILYGTSLSPNNNVKTDYDGNFEFQYLREGSYKIYVYSSDSAAVAGPPINPNAPQKAIVKNVEITSGDQTVDAGTIEIAINK